MYKKDYINVLFIKLKRKNITKNLKIEKKGNIFHFNWNLKIKYKLQTNSIIVFWDYKIFIL